MSTKRNPYFDSAPVELVELFYIVSCFLKRDARIGDVRRAYRKVIEAAVSR